MRRSCRSPATPLLAALTLLAACGGGGGGDARRGATPAARGPASPATRPPSDAEQLSALLERRSAALQRGDARALAATSTGAQQARDRRSARRTRRLGLERVGLSVTAIDLGPRRATLEARSQYGVRGVAGRFSADRRLVAVKGRQGWRVRSETSRRERHPWEVDRVVRRRLRHFVVLAPAGLDLETLPADLEAGYASMREVLRTGRLRRRYLVVVAGGARDARRLTRDIRGVASLAAITDSRVREQGPAKRAVEVLSQRLLVVWPVFRGADPASRTRVVAHELTHAALAGVTSGRTPGWLVEGIALYVSGDRRAGEAAQDLLGPGPRPSLARLGDPDSIARTSGAAQSQGYAYASAAAYHLAERFGERGLLRFYEGFNDESIRGAPGDRRTADRVARATLGISLRRLERDLRRWTLAGGA